jgi:hypothetical protein
VDQIPKDYSHQAEQQSRVSRTLAGVSGLSEATFRGFQSLQANVAFAVVDTALLGNMRFNKRRHSLLLNDALSTAYVARRHLTLSNTGTCAITCLGQLRKTTAIVTNSAIGLKIPAGCLLNTADMQTSTTVIRLYHLHALGKGHAVLSLPVATAMFE